MAGNLDELPASILAILTIGLTTGAQADQCPFLIRQITKRRNRACKRQSWEQSRAKHNRSMNALRIPNALLFAGPKKIRVDNGEDFFREM